MKFPALLLQKAGLAARWRQFRIKRRLAAQWRAELRLRRILGEPGADPVFLDRKLIGPKSDIYTYISAASSVVSQRLSADLVRSGLRCYWCYGDSHDWALIIGAPDERQVRKLTGEAQRVALANRLVPIIARTVRLAEGFRLIIDIDSDERVNASEGWFFRTRGDGPDGQSFQFTVRNGAAVPADLPG